MEAHAVHYNSKYKNFQAAANKSDGLAVAAFFIQACGSKDCPEFKKITEGIRNIQQPKTKCAADSGCSNYFFLLFFRDIFMASSMNYRNFFKFN